MNRRQLGGTQGQLETTEAGGGARLPIVFLHADSGRASQWLEVQLAMSGERRAVAFDFRGHGHSDPARNGEYGFAGRFEDVLSVVDALELHHFVIAGHSGGAAVALEGAATHPKRIAGLFLLDPPADPRAMPQAMKNAMLEGLAGPNSLEVQKEFYASIAGPNREVRERVLADCEAVTCDARLGVARAFVRWNPEPSLKAWRGPIHIVSSKANDNGHALYDLRPDISRTVVPQVGHWIQLDDASLVARALQSFVESVERAEIAGARAIQG
ncbi:MAG: alpha/beta fold hydrolase [Myxococcota bacterium]